MEKYNKVYNKIFMWLFIGLLTSFISGYVLSTSADLMITILTIGLVPIIIIELAIALALGFLLKKMSPTMAKILYLVYSIITGITFSSIFIAYNVSSIVFMFLVAALIFGAMSLYGYATDKDISKLGPILFICLIAVLIVSLINIFIIKSTFIETILCALSIIIFVGYIAYDMHSVKYLISLYGEEKASIYAAFQLYVDFVNLFVRLLELFGKRND